MRRKKHKHARRAVRFYKINGGFREPFKVLLDGNFLHVLLKSSLVENMKDVLGKLLGAPVKTYVTPCILKELSSLGSLYAGEQNASHYFVGSQDRDLRIKLGRSRGARLFVSANGVHIEDPSDFQKRRALQTEAQHMAAGQHEVGEDAGAVEGPAGPLRSGRKKAKGPNPLSVKKKKAKVVAEKAQAGVGLVAEGGVVARKRKRRKHRGLEPG